jgi:hypothetical protein
LRLAWARPETLISTPAPLVAKSGSFAAAHELKTSLTALITDPEQIFEHKHTAQLDVSTLERAQSQVQRLNRLMDGLLDLSRLESGQNSAQHKTFDLVHLVQNVSESFAAQAEGCNLDFDLNLLWFETISDYLRKLAPFCVCKYLSRIPSSFTNPIGQSSRQNYSHLALRQGGDCHKRKSLVFYSDRDLKTIFAVL